MLRTGRQYRALLKLRGGPPQTNTFGGSPQEKVHNLMPDYSSLSVIRGEAEKNFDTREPQLLNHHLGLLGKAHANPPNADRRLAKVGAFADWVFELDNYLLGRKPDLPRSARVEEGYRQRALHQLGKDAEPVMVAELIKKLKIEHAKREEQKKIDQKNHTAQAVTRLYTTTGWHPVYDGTSTSDMDAKLIDRLLLDSAPLKGRPDLVFQDAQSGDLLIIELKTWERRSPHRPAFEWPNLKVQLWCYGHMEWPKSAETVYLQGYVWETSHRDLTGKYFSFTPWRSDDPRRHRESLELFEAFGGKYVRANGGEGS